jgi:periplasmic protein TonB
MDCRHTSRGRQLGISLLVVSALHVAFLWAGEGTLYASSPTDRSVRVASITLSVPRLPAPLPAEVPSMRPAVRPAAAPAAMRSQSAPVASEFLAEEPTATTAEPESATTEDFVPAAQLSSRPTAIDPIEVPYPDAESAKDLTATVELYIDQDGRVVALEPTDQATLAPNYLDAARSAFVGARFAPGLLEGRPVKSRLTIEISFETAGTLPR